jgi:hypothetical protein
MGHRSAKYALRVITFSNALISDAGEGESVALPGIVYNAGTLPFLTSYRPNFCAECGDKIVRLRWRAWTSRTFCDKCGLIFRRAQWLRRGIATVAIVVFGMLIGRMFKREPPPLVIQRTMSSATPSASATPVIEEKVYTCGARTRKGKPCSRRVKEPGRCWQHKG